MRRRKVRTMANIRLPAERRRSRNRVLEAPPRALILFTSRVAFPTALRSSPASVGWSMSASMADVSTRSLRARSRLVATSFRSSASFRASMVCGPHRRTILIKVVGWGTGRSRGIRQNRRQVRESPTSLHRVSYPRPWRCLR